MKFCRHDMFIFCFVAGAELEEFEQLQIALS